MKVVENVFSTTLDQFKTLMARYTEFQINEIKRLYEEEGLPSAEIAHRLSLNVGTVRNRLRKLGFRHVTKTAKLDKDILQELYVNQKLSGPAIAKIFGLSEWKSVYKKLEQFGIPRRSTGAVKKHFIELEDLDVGTSVIIRRPEGMKTFYQNVHQVARRMSFSLSIKRSSGVNFTVTRTE